MTVREQTTDTPRLHGHPTEGRGHVHPGPHHQLPAALRSPDRPTAGHLPREADKRLFLRKGRSRDTLGRAGGKRRTNTKGPVFPRRGPLLTEHSWPIQEMSLTVSGSKVVGSTRENATTLGRRRTMWDKPSAGSLRPPPRASGLSPSVLGYFSLSSPGQEPAPPSPETFRRGNMQERPRGSAERGAPHRGPCPLTRHRRAPGGPRAPGPAKGM